MDVGAIFSRRVTLDADSIRAFAAAAGDDNPLHHDAEAAAHGPFGRIIASGTQVTALMMGLDATYFSQHGEALGLGFEFRFAKPIFAGATLTLQWTIVARTFKASLRGEIVEVRGEVRDDAGSVYVEASGRNLVRKTTRSSA